MSKKLFITGTGTDIGKTFVAGLILKKLKQNGINAAYYKAAMSGTDRRPDGSLIPGDAMHVKEVSGIEQSLEEMCPYVYEHAVSPHLASRLEGNPVQMDCVLKNFEAVCEKYEYVTMEGSGGILCPICFVGLTAFYMKAQEIPLKGIIFNHFQPRNLMHEDNIKMCEYLTGAKVVACVKDGDTDLNISAELLKSLYE